MMADRSPPAHLLRRTAYPRGRSTTKYLFPFCCRGANREPDGRVAVPGWGGNGLVRLVSPGLC